MRVPAFDKRTSHEGGFTLLEVMVVVLVIGILLAVGIPTYLGARGRAQDRAAQTALRDGLGAASVVFSDQATFAGTNPTSLAAAEPGITFVASPTASSNDDTLSVATNPSGTLWAAAARSEGGDCFYIRVDSEGATTFGSSATAACTGETGLATTGSGYSAGDDDADNDNIEDRTDAYISTGALVSRGQPTSQSSTYRSTSPPQRAVDGSYVGTEESHNSHTNADASSWWEVDLGANYAIDNINVWNRNGPSDSVNSRLDGAVVMITTASAGTASFDAAIASAVWTGAIPDAGVIEQFAVPNVVGRYVRIQLPTANFLHLAEVEVFGTPAGG